MPGRRPDPEIAELEDNMAALSEIAQAAQILFLRLRSSHDREEAQRILGATERIQTRERIRRQRAQELWK